eukprot:GHVU01057200.1.p1 GENE.GHVU01057200.1~~GHVU01057200.1.p1  ORF type:complete len:683 (-),score=146.62 GHVU01057200.1:40-2046(-)
MATDEETQQLREALSGVLSPDNEQRRRCEALLGSTSLEALWPHLLARIRDRDEDAGVRSVSAVCLRRKVQERHTKEDEEARAQEGVGAPARVMDMGELSASLLTIWNDESDSGVLRRLSDLISTVAAKSADRNQLSTVGPLWRVLSTHLAADADPPRQLKGLNLLRRLADFQTIAAAAPTAIPALPVNLAALIESKRSHEVSRAACVTAATLIENTERGPTLKMMRKLLPLMLSSSFKAILPTPNAPPPPGSSADGPLPAAAAEPSSEPLEALVSLTEGSRRVWNRFEAPLVESVCANLQNKSIDPQYRRCGLQLLLAFLEDHAAWANQHPPAVAQLVSTISQLCTEGPPSSDQEWMAMTDADENAWEAGDAQETDVQSAAIDAMGTLLESLATDVVGPPFFKEVSAMIALRPEDHDPASSSRAVVEAKVVAGLLLISQCIDNAPHLLHEFDSQLESVLMHFIEHSKCMRVRHAAMGVVRELALEEDPPEWLKTKTTQNVIRCLCESLQQETVARCKRAALSALAQLFEMLQDDTQGIETLRPLIDDLVHKVLVPTVQSSNDSGVTEKCFACVAALAGTAKQHFAPHYPLFASAVKTVITQAVTPETRTLVETCIDAAGVLAECAPVAVVAADAVPLVQRMTELMLLPDEDCMHGAVLPVGRSYLAAT